MTLLRVVVAACVGSMTLSGLWACAPRQAARSPAEEIPGDEAADRDPDEGRVMVDYQHPYYNPFLYPFFLYDRWAPPQRD